MDPVLLSLVGLVIVLSFLFVIVLILWVRLIIREKNEYREVVVILKRKLLEEKINPQEWPVMADNLADFILAYYERVKARGEKKRELANENMKLYWECLPKGFQEKLAILGGLANLKVSGDPVQ